MSGMCLQLWTVRKPGQGGIFWAANFSPSPPLHEVVYNTFERGGTPYFRPLFMCLDHTQIF